MVEQYRANGRRALLSSPTITEENVSEIEERVWLHSAKKYPVVIRRMCQGVPFATALTEFVKVEEVPEEDTSVDGVIWCRKCKSRKGIKSFQQQTRGGDEPITTFCYCPHCEVSWKF